MIKEKQEIFKAISKDEIYDYIANNYYMLSKELLKDIILEALWSGYNSCGTNKYNDELLSNLADRWEA